MAKKDKTHISETPATQLLKAHQVPFVELTYDYVEHGGSAESSRQLGLDEHTVVKTLIMQDQDAKPLVVLMCTALHRLDQNLARQIGAKSVQPCKPEVANRHSGYLVGGTSPFATRKPMPVYIESRFWTHPKSPSMAGDVAICCSSIPRCACSCRKHSRCRCTGTINAFVIAPVVSRQGCCVEPDCPCAGRCAGVLDWIPIVCRAGQPGDGAERPPHLRQRQPRRNQRAALRL